MLPPDSVPRDSVARLSVALRGGRPAAGCGVGGDRVAMRCRCRAEQELQGVLPRGCARGVRDALSGQAEPAFSGEIKVSDRRLHPSLTEADDDWRSDARESRDDVTRRIHDFFIWLLRQPHDNVAVVTHGVWMECAILAYCPEALEFGRKRVYNCEVYHGRLAGGGGEDGVGVALRDVEQLAMYYA